MLRYLHPPHIKDRPSIIVCKPIINFKKLASKKSTTFEGKWYLAAVGTCCEIIYESTKVL